MTVVPHACPPKKVPVLLVYPRKPTAHGSTQEAKLGEFAGLTFPLGHAAMAVPPVQYELAGQAVVVELPEGQ